MRYIIKLSYDGSAFHGWQIQPSDNSVQETLEKALSMLLRSGIKLTGAGRTDTGVNATGYIAHFDYTGTIDRRWVNYKLNAILPDTIVVHSVDLAGEDFHSRFDAKSRKYTYYLHRVKDPFLVHYSYLCSYPELDFELMNRAAELLLGYHDFSCFEKIGADNKTSICTVNFARWEPYQPTVCAWAQKPSSDELLLQGSSSRHYEECNDEQSRNDAYYWKFTISADRFLRNMVRCIVGTLLEVGRGKRSIENFASLILKPLASQAVSSSQASSSLRACEAIASNSEITSVVALTRNDGGKRRSLAGESVPGHALFLDNIEY